MTPCSTWLNAPSKDEKFSRNIYSTTPSNSLESQEKGLMMYYKPYRNRAGSLDSDTSTKSDSGRNTLRKKPQPLSENSSAIRIERSGTVEKDSKSLPSPVSSPKITMNNAVDSANSAHTSEMRSSQSLKDLAIPRPSRSFQVLSPVTMVRASVNEPNRRLQKRESKAVIQSPPE